MAEQVVNTASRDWAVSNAWRMRHYKGAKATVPGGHEIAVTDDYLDVMPPGSEEDGIIDRVTEFLKNPRPGHLYLWRPRNDDDTMRMVELGMLEFVPWNELIRSAATIGLHSFQESGVPSKDSAERVVGTYIGWKKMALYVAGPALAKRWRVDPERYHMKLVSNVPEESQEILNDFGTTTLVRKDPRTWTEEIEHDARTRRR